MTAIPKKKKPVYTGLSVTSRAVELAVFNPKTMSVDQVVSTPMPVGVFDADADNIQDAALLKEIIGQTIRAVKPKPACVNLSLPGSLLRMVEMPKMDPAGLYISLASEAERYKTFDNTEAIVDFVLFDQAQAQNNMQHLVFGAVRSDALGQYMRILKDLHVQVAGISLEPLDILRGMAGTGVLDGLVQQIGLDAYWGVIFVEPNRIRLSVWQADRLVELRETQIDTSEFSAPNPDSIMVEDMLEEIRRTTKNIQPSLWLTQNMPPAMEQILSSRLGCPFHPAPVGNGLQMQQPMQLSTVGSALTSVVQFPFDFDLAAGMGKTSGMPMAAGGGGQGEGDAADIGWMIPAGVASIVIFGLITAGLFGLSTFTSMQLPEVQKKRDESKLVVAGLEARQRELKKKVELDQTLMQMVDQAKIRNHIYVALTDDLVKKTPEKVWIHTLKAADNLEMQGKAMSHQSVINFARSFDQAPYSKAIQISAIKEGRLNGALVYDFKIGGNVFLNPALAEKKSNSPDAPPAAEASGSANASKPGA
jgi:Tfp pilus assembly protein PilN